MKRGPGQPVRDRAALDPALARRKVGHARTVAMVNGVMFALSVPIALAAAPMEPLAGLTAAALLVVFAVVEFKGAAGLRRLDPLWPGRLSANQTSVAVVVSAYCAWRMLRPFAPPRAVLEAMVPDAEQRRLVLELWPIALILTYLLVGLIAVLLCGGNALYYRTRRKWVEAARAGGPAREPELAASRGPGR